MNDHDLRQAQTLCLQLIAANTTQAAQLALLSQALDRIAQGTGTLTPSPATKGIATDDAWQKLLALVSPEKLASNTVSAPAPTGASERAKIALAAINHIVNDVNARLVAARTETNLQTSQFSLHFNPQAEISRQITYYRNQIALFHDGISRLEGWLAEAKTLFDARLPLPYETLRANLADYRKSIDIVTDGLTKTLANGAQTGAVTSKAAQEILESMKRIHQGWTDAFDRSNNAFNDYLKS